MKNFMFLNSSRNRHSFCYLFGNMFRYSGTRSFTNAIAQGKLRIDEPVMYRPLTVALQLEQLLPRLVQLKEYPKDMARSLSVDIDNLQISVGETSLNYAFHCYCLSNRLRVDFGLSILARLFKKDRVPNELISSILTSDDDTMGIFKENRRTSETKELFKKIVRGRSCDIDVVSYGTLIDGLCKDGHSMIAVEVLRNRNMVQRLDTRTLNMIIEGWKKESEMYFYLEIFYKVLQKDMGLCEGRKVYSALKSFYSMLWQEMVRGGSIYNGLICGLCDMRLDRKIYPDVKTKGFESPDLEDALVDMIEINCLQRRLGKARKVFHFMDRNNIAPNAACYCILIEACCRKKENVVHVMNLYREMRCKGLAPDVFTYNLILPQLFLTGRCSVALQIFEELQVVGLKPDCVMYCNMLLGMCQNGQVEQAFSLLSAWALEGVPLHIEYYNIVIEGYRKDEQVERAKGRVQDLFSNLEQVKAWCSKECLPEPE